jgi:RNase P/RNase MRP subunit POP5
MFGGCWSWKMPPFMRADLRRLLVLVGINLTVVAYYQILGFVIATCMRVDLQRMLVKLMVVVDIWRMLCADSVLCGIRWTALSPSLISVPTFKRFEAHNRATRPSSTSGSMPSCQASSPTGTKTIATFSRPPNTLKRVTFRFRESMPGPTHVCAHVNQLASYVVQLYQSTGIVRCSIVRTPIIGIVRCSIEPVNWHRVLFNCTHANQLAWCVVQLCAANQLASRVVQLYARQSTGIVRCSIVSINWHRALFNCAHSFASWRWRMLHCAT